MEIVLFIALGVAIGLLWKRVTDLEMRMELADGGLDYHRQPEADERPRADRIERDPVSISKASSNIVLTRPNSDPDVAAEPARSAIVDDLAPVTVEQKPSAEDVTTQENGSFDSGRTFDFEDLFGRLLPIWFGGITLAVAGFFIVRYSIESGLLTPAVRVFLGFLFGLGLIGGAEAAYRFEKRVSDPRVRQALSGAGVATLYACFYLAGSLYGLISPLTAFVALAVVTVAAVGLSYRFGMPSAVLGLIGGFAAPLLAGGNDANVPMLTLYLALVTGGLMASARQRRWAWLGLAALGGGLGWGTLLLVTGVISGTDVFVLGAFVIVIGAVLPAFCSPHLGEKRWLVEGVAAGIAAVQMALLVAQADHGLLAWGMFVILAIALAVLGWRKEGLRRASAFAALLVPLLLMDWDPARPLDLVIIVSAFALLLAGAPAAHVWRRTSGTIDQAQIIVSALGLFGAISWHAEIFGQASDHAIAISALLLATFPVASAWRTWPVDDERARPSMLAYSATVMLLILLGSVAVVQEWVQVAVAAVITGGWIWLARDRGSPGTWNLGWAAALVAFWLLFAGSDWAEFEHLWGAASGIDGEGALRWAAIAVLCAAMSSWDHRQTAQRVAEALAAMTAYGAAAQLLPSESLAWLAAFAAVALALTLPRRIVGQAALLVIAVAWAAEPLSQWAIQGTNDLIGDPLLVTEIPGPRDLALRILPVVGAGLAVVIYRHRQVRPLVLASAIGLLVSLHIAFKQVFAISSVEEFANIGLAERTLWEVLLLSLTWSALRVRGGRAWVMEFATVLGLAAFAHWLLFTMALHNPMWSLQAVGPWPIANLLLPVYAIGFCATVWAQQWDISKGTGLRHAVDGVTMLLIALLVLASLRHGFSGSWLTLTPVGELENLLRSLAGILLAIGFLGWGARTQERSWRIGSLVLMLVAVCKVFLVDAAGLEGLARIASFVALGFSLIGIGWFYSRQLRRQS